MKKISMFCVLAILASAGAARADIYIRGQGIFVLPMDAPYSSGIGFGVAAGWDLNPQFALELGANRWSLPSAGIVNGLSLGKIAALPIEISLRARLPLGTKLNLLGDVGLGYAFHSFTIDEDLTQSWNEVGFVIEESAKSGLAAHLGAGLELALSPGVSVDISARYYLLREGYAFLTFALEQVVEPGFPATRLIAEGNRFVGLRFVRPVETAPGQRIGTYAGDAAPIERIADADADWLFYALPQSADPFDQQLTHQKVLFAGAGEVEHVGGGLVPGGGVNFKQLLAAIEAGTIGREVQAGWTAADLMEAAGGRAATMYLVVNGHTRIVFALWGSAGL